MKTNFKNAKCLSAIIIAAVTLTSTLNAQPGNSSDDAGKFLSMLKERKSSLAIEKLNQLTNAIEEQIRFRVPTANDNVQAVPVLLTYTPGNKEKMVKSTVAYRPGEVAKERSTKKKKTIDDTTSFRSWIKSSLKTELGEVNKTVSGTVVVSFTVDEKGEISDAKVVSPSDKDVDKIVLDVINESPKWEVKEANNQPIKQNYTLPISYKVKKYTK